MESQAFQQMINSPGLWITSGVMVIASVLQAFIFFRTSLKEAKELGIERQKYRAGIRSAVITSIGPSFSPVIVLMSMVAVLGGPTTWMRLCDVGAARTELAVVSLAAGLAGTEVGSASFGSTAFSYSLWAMALNNLGWLVIVLLLTPRMNGIVVKRNTKFDPKWVKLLMGGATLGLFAYLLTNQLVGKASIKWVAAVLSGAIMLILTTVFKKHQRIQELALGIAMLGGMFLTQAIMG